MDVSLEALELNGRLISTDQLLYQEELRNKFQQMQSALATLFKEEERVSVCHIIAHFSPPMFLVLVATTVKRTYVSASYLL